MATKILYVDMDNVIADSPAALERIRPDLRTRYAGNEDEIPGIFNLIKPRPGAVRALNELADLFDLYILATAPWENPSAWSDKLDWAHHYLGHTEQDFVHKRLVLSHHKDLNSGDPVVDDLLVDDRPDNGTREFPGQWIHFGNGVDKYGRPCPDHAEHPYTDWPTTLHYLKTQT